MLEQQLEFLRGAPRDSGPVTLLTRRPASLAREVLETARVTRADGLVGDTWLERARARLIADGRHLAAQVTVMSSRMIGLLADSDADRAEAGDQLHVDLDLSHANLPAGSRLAVGSSLVLEVSTKPHNGCAKFVTRFGPDATAFVNSAQGRELRLRGLNARVLADGEVRRGDTVTVLHRETPCT